jgi:hypothetical protein
MGKGTWRPGKDWIATCRKARICSDFRPSGRILCTGVVYRFQAGSSGQHERTVRARSTDVTEQTEADSAEGGTPRRVDVELFVVHPTWEPTNISIALGLEPHFAHRVGDPRKTPTGNPLPGNYQDTRWRHCIRCTVRDQWYAAEVTRLVDRLGLHRAFFADLKSTGGTACVVIQFLGDGYFGDEIPRATLAKLVDLELGLGIECFVDPQS